jgi:hydroxymethylpyrimidine pyrophosphatase-like HAD family hydrolase
VTWRLALRFPVIATDFDGTLAQDGCLDRRTVTALLRVRESGRRVILITGRELENLRQTFPGLDLFDAVVAENGAVLYHPSTREEKVLASVPPTAFVERLRQDGVNPLSVGRCIVATVTPHEGAVRRAIRELQLDLQVIFNREAVMVLPAGVDKGTGLNATMADFGVSSANALGFGDAENDFAFLNLCGLSVAVANAIPSLKAKVHVVSVSGYGAGVTEVVEKLLAGTLA